MRILVVCSGNICRSPIAQELFIKEAKQRGYSDSFEIKSCGTLGISGEPASKNSIIVGRELGLDLTGFASTGVSEELIQWADKIYCLAENHMEFFKKIRRSEKTLLLSTRQVSISDPYGKDVDVYRNCMAEVSEAVKNRMDELCGSL